MTGNTHDATETDPDDADGASGVAEGTARADGRHGAPDGGGPDDPTFEADALFDPDHYLPWVRATLEDGRTDREADFLASVLSLTGGDRVLDAPCGHGRHANRLAARGHEVTGLDRSDPFLRAARADARERGVSGAVDYRRGDLRDLPFADDAFAAAYNVFSSFGFFDEAGNRRTLDELARVVRPGGRLVLELADRDALLREYRPESVTDLPDGYLVERREYDPLTGRNRVERVVVRDGEVREATYELRLYSYTELRSLLGRAGFAVVDVYGDLTGADHGETNRLCVVARRESHGNGGDR